MSITPVVNVVIPAYNCEITINQSINSVLTQSWRNLELIVVDDSSTDGTAATLEGISDTRLHIVRHDRNCGAAAARNTGIQMATGKYVAFLDSDDP